MFIRRRDFLVGGGAVGLNAALGSRLAWAREMSDGTPANPFEGVTIGSSVDRSGAFHSSVLAQGSQITNMVTQYYAKKSMRGQSDLVYTTQMNQASLSLAGAYGVSGVEKVTASVSAYWGNSSGENSKSTSIVLEALIRAGFETISFDDLTPASLMSAMRLGPKQSATRALELYNALEQELNQAKLVDVLSQTPNSGNQAVRDAYASWASETEKFRANYGEGVVVGIVWGGIGRSELAIEDKASANSWKYGGAAEFSYAGVGASLSIGATYDASGSSAKSNVTVHCSSFTNGTCAKEYTDAWDAALRDKAFDAVANVQPLAISPPTVTATLLKAPDFVEPKPDPKAEDELKSVSKDGLEGLAKAAAYDRFKALYDKTRKPNDPEFADKLEDFLKKAEQPPNAKPIRELGSKVRNNSLSTLSLLPAAREPAARKPTPMAGTMSSLDASPPDLQAFVPIGIWVSNWAELFPWLATGYLNAIDDMAAAETAIKFRMLLQDFQTLSRLYYYAANYNLSLPAEANASPSDFTQIADSFAVQYRSLVGANVKPDKYGEAAADAIGHLGDASRAIYQVWDKIKFLRNAELGLGVVIGGSSSPIWPAQAEPHTPDVAQWADNAPCGFNPSGQNYSAFAQFIKVMPLILPKTNKIIALGPGGFLCPKWGPRSSMFSRFEGPIHREWDGGSMDSPGFPPLEFTANLETRVLENKAESITLYPIPFSAAEGVQSWKGQSVSTNVGGDADLIAQIKKLGDDLAGMKTWSYSSASLPDGGWTAADVYQRASLGKQYFGMLPEPGGAF